MVLVALLVRFPIPSWLGLILMVWFVGGFVYLVASMRPGPARRRRRRGRRLARPTHQGGPPRDVSDIVEIRGHLIDSGSLSRVLNDITEYGGDYVVQQFDIGHGTGDPSYARIEVSADDEESLQRTLMRLQTHGVNQVDPGEAEVGEADQDGVFPDGFYSSTNLETQVRLDGHWLEVDNPEMDCGLIVDDDRRRHPRAHAADGRRRRPACRSSAAPAASRSSCRSWSKEAGGFGFMESDVSSEKPQAVLVRQVADGMREAKEAGKKVLWVGGPGVVHTGAAPAMVALVEAGYVDVLFAGNALATHDIESALYGTSLGIDLARGQGVEHGHEHHIRAINTIRKAGLDPRRRRPGRADQRDHARAGHPRQGRSCWSARCATTARCPTSTPT